MKKYKLYVTKKNTVLEPMGLVIKNIYRLLDDDQRGSLYFKYKWQFRNIFDYWGVTCSNNWDEVLKFFKEIEFKSEQEMLEFIEQNEPCERRELREKNINKKSTLLNTPLKTLSMLGI